MSSSPVSPDALSPASPASPAKASQWQPGDILACYGNGWTSRAIRWGTWGPSHVGIVCYHQGEPLLVESTSLCHRPCVIQGRQWSGVQAQRVEDRIADYGGQVERWSLVPGWSLSRRESSLLTEILTKHYIGRRYDTDSAVISGTRVIKFLSLLPYPDEDVFCAELVAGVLMRLCRMGHANPATFNPGSLLRRLRREGKISKAELPDTESHQV